MSEIEEKSEALAQAKMKAQRTAKAFLALFGRPEARNDSQNIVLGHLAHCAGDDGNSYRFNDARDGIALVAAGIHRDGARSILRVIERQVELASRQDSPKPKPKIRKQS